MEDNGRATTSFMRQLKRMFDEVPDVVWWDRGAIVIGDRDALERVLPQYYRTSKFSSFQRQLNNFGYHRSYDRGNNWRGVCYCKVVGAPATDNVEDLLALRPLVRRKKRRADDDDDSDDMLPKRQHVLMPKPYWPHDNPQLAYLQPHVHFRPPTNDPNYAPSNHNDVGPSLTESLAEAARCLLSMGDSRLLAQTS